MKTNYTHWAILFLFSTFLFSACSDSDDETDGGEKPLVLSETPEYARFGRAAFGVVNDVKEIVRTEYETDDSEKILYVCTSVFDEEGFVTNKTYSYVSGVYTIYSYKYDDKHRIIEELTVYSEIVLDDIKGQKKVYIYDDTINKVSFYIYTIKGNGEEAPTYKEVHQLTKQGRLDIPEENEEDITSSKSFGRGVVFHPHEEYFDKDQKGNILEYYLRHEGKYEKRARYQQSFTYYDGTVSTSASKDVNTIRDDFYISKSTTEVKGPVKSRKVTRYNATWDKQTNTYVKEDPSGISLREYDINKHITHTSRKSYSNRGTVDSKKALRYWYAFDYVFDAKYRVVKVNLTSYNQIGQSSSSFVEEWEEITYKNDGQAELKWYGYYADDDKGTNADSFTGTDIYFLDDEGYIILGGVDYSQLNKTNRSVIQSKKQRSIDDEFENVTTKEQFSEIEEDQYGNTIQRITKINNSEKVSITEYEYTYY